MKAALLVSLVIVAACKAPPPASAPEPTVSRADTIVWSAADPLPTARDHHVTFVTSRGGQAHLWVIGGNDYRRTMSDSWYTTLRNDGSTGVWTSGPSLPGQRAGMGVGVSDRFVILSGGKDSAQKTVTDIFVAPINDDGRLGEWRAGGHLPGPRFHHATLIHGPYLYVVGGLEAAVSVPAVLRGRISSDGTIVTWDSLTPLPRPRSHQSMFVHGNALYLVGGLDGNPAGANTPLSDVIRAPFLADGNLGAWQEVSKMDHAYATHATALYGGAVWLFGGVEDNARFVDVVLRAPISADGSIGSWKQLTVGLPAARSHVHQVPVFRDKAYSAAGSNRRVVTTDVHIGTFR